jgi:hypothetical protein
MELEKHTRLERHPLSLSSWQSGATVVALALVDISTVKKKRDIRTRLELIIFVTVWCCDGDAQAGGAGHSRTTRTVNKHE